MTEWLEITGSIQLQRYCWFFNAIKCSDMLVYGGFCNV